MTNEEMCANVEVREMPKTLSLSVNQWNIPTCFSSHGAQFSLRRRTKGKFVI
jgi:hypothetical protein